MPQGWRHTVGGEVRDTVGGGYGIPQGVTRRSGVWQHRSGRLEEVKVSDHGLRFGLYTILPSPILYGVWHSKEGSVGGRVLRNGRAIVLHQGMLCRWGVSMKGRLPPTIRLYRATTSCKG